MQWLFCFAQNLQTLVTILIYKNVFGHLGYNRPCHGPRLSFISPGPQSNYTQRKLGPKAPSSETQGQIVGAKESLNGRKNKARRKVKNGEKSPWGQCLTRPVSKGRRRSGF